MLRRFSAACLLLVPLLLLPPILQAIAALLVGLYFAFRNRPSDAQSAAAFFRRLRFGGHKGSPINAPENTMASFRLAEQEGVDFVEFDVSLTGDGVAILMHDDTLDRTTNLSGPLRTKSYPQLVEAKCNCAAKFKPPSSTKSLDSAMAGAEHAPICTLDELVEWAKERRMKLVFDVKDTDKGLIDKLDSLFEQHDLYELAIVCSFFPSVVYRVRRHNPRILTGLTWRRWVTSYADCEFAIPRYPSSPLRHYVRAALDLVLVLSIESLVLPRFLGVCMLLTERAEISENLVRQLRENGLEVCAWTVNDETEMAWMHHKLRMPFLTDYPLRAKSLISDEWN